MDISGRLIQITGSISEDADGLLIENAHLFVKTIVRKVIDAGGGLVLGVAGEPRGKFGPYIFDWTALEVIGDSSLKESGWPENRSDRFFVVASQRGLEKIPGARKELWEKIRTRNDFNLRTTTPSWKMASLIRKEQLRKGDLLLVLGGGAGVEHLARTYANEGKPVVPILSEVGSLSNDGRGGANYLYKMAMEDASEFFALKSGVGNPAGRLAGLKLETETEVEVLSTEVISLIQDILPPKAFYVRLTNKNHENFKQVESFYRKVVDPLVESLGYESHEVGRDDPMEAFINVEIFKGIHRAGAVFVDLTGLRPNCFIELGYALGRQRNYVLSAMKGTQLPFDADKMPTFFWDPAESSEELIKRFREWAERYFNVPPVVE